MADLVHLSLLCVINIPHFFKLQKGVSSARSDDTKSLKGVVLNWIAARDMALLPPLSRNVKTNRGFHHPVTGALLCPAGLDWNEPELVPSWHLFLHSSSHWFRVRAKLSSGEMAVSGDQWPLLMYANQQYDPEDPLEGLFRSHLLVWVCSDSFLIFVLFTPLPAGI
jgi:hypothetical protein